MILIRTVLPIHSWMGLGLDAVLAGGLGYAFMMVIYGRDELNAILGKLKK